MDANTDIKNWAGNIRFNSSTVHYPETVDDLQAFVGESTTLKIQGTRHSFNRIADSKTALLSLEKMPNPIVLDKANQCVSVPGHMPYGELALFLQKSGYALHNLASLPHISIAGACATGTHGSGISNGSLATAVQRLEFVNGRGELISQDKGDAEFYGCVTGLGAIGIITRMHLKIMPSYEISQLVYEDLPISELEHNFDAIMSSAYSVSFFTNWQSDVINQVWLKLKQDDYAAFDTEEFYGAQQATKDMHPIGSESSENCTLQIGLAGPCHERLPHFKMDYTPSWGEELQTEYIIPREHAWTAIQTVATFREELAELLLITEIRCIAADEFWLSPFYQQESIAIHFTCKQDWPVLEPLLLKIEDALAPFSPRPHWGKLFVMEPDSLKSRYPRLTDFQKLMKKHDPDGKFHNDFLLKYIH